ncbi:WW domain-containing protein [Escovopsis weberi]|uniref:WW domain-containing protein n=1 Tax=Escovopsis weberi TaxID=150374 RepID=A0A0M9VT98_ESCWE|nr:WW domain-containing protein [Escovopsis weberi]
MSSPAPAAATPRELDSKSPLAAGGTTPGVTEEEEDGNTGAEPEAAAAAAADTTTTGPDDDKDSETSAEEGETDDSPAAADSPYGSEAETDAAAPPLPSEPVPGRNCPPLPNEAVPFAGDDGWDCQWDANTQAWFFYNRFTGQTQWENPRVPSTAAGLTGALAGAGGASSRSVPQPPEHEKPVAGGYNPAIHGDYDPNAWYAQGDRHEDDEYAAAAAAAGGASWIDPATGAYAATAGFNRFHGGFQAGDAGPERHSDEAKARRQMNTYFDVDAAANAHGGRSLKAERSNKKPTKSELKAFKEKRRARKEEKRRAWLRD